MKAKLLLSLTVIIVTLFFIACQKDQNGNSTLKVRLTDAPTALEEVNIDLQQVNIKFEKDSGNWTRMQTNAGIYNLLDFQNGVDTLIAQGNFPEEDVKEIRLVLGTNNTVKEGGNIYPLRIPSGGESGLKIKINRRLRTGLDSLVIDFDAFLSIKKEADHYKLRPVIRLK
jgi:hypothetical protein